MLGENLLGGFKSSDAYQQVVTSSIANQDLEALMGGENKMLG